MLSRRPVLASFLALAACRPGIAAEPHLGGRPLPDFAGLWSSLPLPFTPAEAWNSLPASVQTEIGAAVIGMALAEYIAGDGRADEDQFHSDALRDQAAGAAHDILNAMPDRLWGLFPELYGPDGDHPTWVLNNGFAR